MKIKSLGAAAALSVLGLGPAAAAEPCDRACLTKTLDAYLTALTRSDPTAAPLAAGYRATENGREVARGEGLWRSAKRLGALQRRYYDPVSGGAAYYGVIEEDAGASVMILRIKVDGRKITESEVIIARKGDALFSVEGAMKDAPPPAVAIPAADRAPREALRKAADSYFQAIQDKDDSLVIREPGCVRVESGTRVTQRRPPALANAPAVEFHETDCGEGLAKMTQIDQVILRRFPVLDEEAGVAVGIVLFTRPPSAVRPDGQPWPRNLLSEVFTTKQGRITGIYASMHYLAKEAPTATGW